MPRVADIPKEVSALRGRAPRDRMWAIVSYDLDGGDEVEVVMSLGRTVREVSGNIDLDAPEEYEDSALEATSPGISARALGFHDDQAGS